MNSKNRKDNISLVPRPQSAVEKFEPGAKHVLALMVFDTLAIAQKHLAPATTSPTKAEVENWCRMGDKYYWGRGVPQNYVEAMKWFRKAAEQGHANAQNYIGHCHYCGFGVRQDYTESVKWFRKAAEQCNPAAPFNLSDCYEHGLGVHQDHVEAYKWFKIGIDIEGGDIGDLRKALATKSFVLSPEQIAEGERRYKEFKVRAAQSAAADGRKERRDRLSRPTIGT